MSTATFRRNGDKPLRTSWLALCFRFRFLLIVLAFLLTLSLILVYPHDWFNRAAHVEPTKAEPVKKKLEAMTDFHFVTDETKWIGSGRKTKRIHVVDKANQNVPLSYGQVLNLLQSNAEFRDDFFDVLRKGLQSFSDGDINSYFFETPPVTDATKNDVKFEFVLVSAKELNDVTADPSAFDQYFEECSSGIAVFPNLGADAILIAPCRPEKYKSLDTFAHLANFMRSGSHTQMHDFWIEVGRQMEKRLKEKPEEKIWMSTCGTGIYWLHLRMDSRPKYYTYTPYREA